MILLPTLQYIGIQVPEGKNEAMIYALMNVADIFLFFNSYMIYQVIRRVVKQIDYLVDENKIEIKQYSSWGLEVQKHIFDPKELVKAPRSPLTPLLGYTHKDNAKIKLSTNGISNWSDK